ncbi:MAG: 4-hydroxy-tetrahydrodipicolinate synthase [Thermoplasmata archaeon]
MNGIEGCYTALVTPMKENREIDEEGLRQLIEFQAKNKVDGILAVGTTGESATLDWEEHDHVIQFVKEHLGSRGITIGGTGSNNAEETVRGTEHAADIGVEAVLLVDPYYNGPSSLEIRREYLEPIAKGFPDIQVIPYVIPGRSGTQLYPQDLAVLSAQYENIRSVKEATGDMDNIRRTRELCGEDFDILSGDDGLNFELMSDPDVSASGAISVASNVAPGAVGELIRCILDGEIERARQLDSSLRPLFDLVTVKTTEQTPYGPVLCRARNPLPYKTLMNILGMPSGSSRPPLGKMTLNGTNHVLETARQVYDNDPEILEPVEEFFDVDLGERLYRDDILEGLHYD